VTVTASDPDGDGIGSLTATGLPAEATFTPAPDNATGTLTWTPSFSQAGSYTVTFTAANVLSGLASTVLTVINVDRPPVLTAPGSVTAPADDSLTVTVTASDPDGDAIASLTATGLPAGATFTPAPDNASGILSWTPGQGDEGSHSVTFTASNALVGEAVTSITVGPADHAPQVSVTATAEIAEDQPLTVTVTASDPDGDAIATLTATSLPAGATFTPAPDNASGTLTWTPGFTQSGSYTVTFTAANAKSSWAATAITVTNVDRPPALTAPGTVTVTAGNPLTVTVTASDPDGDGIGSLTATGLPAGATFTPAPDNASGILSWTPGQVDEGSHTVTFTASNALSEEAATNIVVVGAVGVLDRPRGRAPLRPILSPSPLRSRSIVSFSTARQGSLRVVIFEAAGRHIRTLMDQQSAPPGPYQIPVDGQNDHGGALPSGAYFLRVESAGESASRRFIVTR